MAAESSLGCQGHDEVGAGVGRDVLGGDHLDRSPLAAVPGQPLGPTSATDRSRPASPLTG